MNSQHENIDPAKKTKITNVAALRAVVAGYLFYLGFTILRDVIRGEPGSLPLWLLWLVGIVFMLAALAFGYYTWRQYQKETGAMKDSSASEQSKPEEAEDERMIEQDKDQSV